MNMTASVIETLQTLPRYKQTKLTVALLGVMTLFGCSQASLTPQELPRQTWLRSDYDKDFLIAKALTQNHIYDCSEYRFKTLQRGKADSPPDNSGKVWVHCSDDGRHWHQNLVVWPQIKQLDRLANKEQVYNYL